MTVYPYTVEMNEEYGGKLIELGFSPRLLCEPEFCKIWYEHCTKYNMKFLEGSYGTLVHKDFDKYFKVASKYKIMNNMCCEIPDVFLDHKNFIQSKLDKSVYILTTSPYHIFNWRNVQRLSKCNVSTLVINNQLLDYHGFVRHDIKIPLKDLNYAFTYASAEQIDNIVEDMEDSVRYAFTPLVRGGLK